MEAMRESVCPACGHLIVVGQEIDVVEKTGGTGRIGGVTPGMWRALSERELWKIRSAECRPSGMRGPRLRRLIFRRDLVGLGICLTRWKLSDQPSLRIPGRNGTLAS